MQHGGNLGELKLVLSAIEPSLRRYGQCPRVEKTINNNPLDSRPACRSRGATAQRGEILSRLLLFSCKFAFWRYIYLFNICPIVHSMYEFFIKNISWKHLGIKKSNATSLHYARAQLLRATMLWATFILWASYPTLPLPACFADLLSTWSLQLPCVLHKL